MSANTKRPFLEDVKEANDVQSGVKRIVYNNIVNDDELNNIENFVDSDLYNMIINNNNNVQLNNQILLDNIEPMEIQGNINSINEKQNNNNINLDYNNVYQVDELDKQNTYALNNNQFNENIELNQIDDQLLNSNVQITNQLLNNNIQIDENFTNNQPINVDEKQATNSEENKEYLPLPSMENRQINTFYLYKNEIRYWDGVDLKCEHKKIQKNCEDCKTNGNYDKNKKTIINTIEEAKALFSSCGHTLISTEYVDSKSKLEYDCKCGNKGCHISISNLKKGIDNCKKCSSAKQKKTNMEKFGVDNPFKSETIKNNIKQSNLAKHGVEHNLQRKDVQEKIKKTNIERFGAENVFKSEVIKNKIKQQNVANYGVEHHSQRQDVKEKVKQTNYDRFGQSHPLKNQQVMEKRNQTNIERYGFSTSLQNKAVKEKGIQTLVNKYGQTNIMSVPEIQAKAKQTMIDRYGKSNPMQIDEFKEKAKNTVKEIYGVENVFQNEHIKEKVVATNQLRYGFSSAMKNPEIKQKVKDTNQRLYGSENVMYLEEFKEKLRNSFKEKYGVEHALQVPEFLEKAQKSGFTQKSYKFPSGAEIQIQGYEHFTYDFLLNNGYTEEDLIGGYNMRYLMEIMYQFEGKEHRYFPDILIPSEMKFIEVKSQWTFDREKDKNIAKMKAVLEVTGFPIEVWIFDKEGVLIEILDKFD